MIKAFKFGMLDPVSGFDQTALDTLYLRNKLWNALVELERGHREKYRALLTGSNDELSAIQARLDEIEAERADLVARKKKARAMARSKKVDTSEIDASIDALVAERASLREKAKALRASIKEQIRPKLDVLEAERREAIKKLTRESGLWWANCQVP